MTDTGIVFIFLKVSGAIEWPWWAVLSPFWLGIIVWCAAWFLENVFGE